MRAVQVTFEVRDYDLDATLSSGQAFRWHKVGDCWEGVIGTHWVRLLLIPRLESKENAHEAVLVAEVAEPVEKWNWLTDYLQLEVDLGEVLTTFPKDASMQSALDACAGLRLLRQDPWECLVSFICSSTKQIVQIQEIIGAMCRRFGDAVSVPEGHKTLFSFPTAERLAEATEGELRDCKMGFRAPYVLSAARKISSGELDLTNVGKLPLQEARECLMQLPGVGPKIADCVLLFAYSFAQAFPVDVWILRALRELYFPKRKESLRRLRQFSQTYFGPNAGYAQQYLFHYMRVRRSPVRRQIAAGVLSRRKKAGVLEKT